MIWYKILKPNKCVCVCIHTHTQSTSRIQQPKPSTDFTNTLNNINLVRGGTFEKFDNELQVNIVSANPTPFK